MVKHLAWRELSNLQKLGWWFHLSLSLKMHLRETLKHAPDIYCLFHEALPYLGGKRDGFKKFLQNLGESLDGVIKIPKGTKLWESGYIPFYFRDNYYRELQTIEDFLTASFGKGEGGS